MFYMQPYHAGGTSQQSANRFEYRRWFMCWPRQSILQNIPMRFAQLLLPKTVFWVTILPLSVWCTSCYYARLLKGDEDK